MRDEYIALAIILGGALYSFWTGKLRTDITALLVVLALIIPWPHHDGRWRPILSYKEGFSGFGSAAVVMVVAMFILGAAIVRTGLVAFLGGGLFKACAHNERLLQFAVLMLTTTVSMFVNDTTVVLVFLPIIMSVCREKALAPGRYLNARGLLLSARRTMDAHRHAQQHCYQRLFARAHWRWVGLFRFYRRGGRGFCRLCYLLSVSRAEVPAENLRDQPAGEQPRYAILDRGHSHAAVGGTRQEARRFELGLASGHSGP
jgi:hypothetical protein